MAEVAGVCYSIRENRIRQGYRTGFGLSEGGRLYAEPGFAQRCLYLRGLNGVRRDAQWGRLHYEAEFSENMVCTVYVAALNEDSFYHNGVLTAIDDFLCSPAESPEIKRRFLERAGAKRCVNRKDILLYELSGKYLYIALELLGDGEAFVSGMRIEQQGDNFMNTFPEIYRERNSFFHRFISVFSSMYNDFQMEIDNVSDILDLDSCPQELLLTYGRWLGLALPDEFAQEPWLRALVKEAYSLNRMKGTKWAVGRVCEIVLGEKVIVLENNVARNYIREEEREMYRKLYGSSRYDVSILVRRFVPERAKVGLMFLLEQFKPARSRIRAVYLQDSSILDQYSCLDINARALREENGKLDGGQHPADRVMVLRE